MYPLGKRNGNCLCPAVVMIATETQKKQDGAGRHVVTLPNTNSYQTIADTAFRVDMHVGKEEDQSMMLSGETRRNSIC